MIDLDPSAAYDFVGILVRIFVSVIICNSLLFLLAMRCFPDLAIRIRQNGAKLLLELATGFSSKPKLSPTVERALRWLDPALKTVTRPPTSVTLNPASTPFNRLSPLLIEQISCNQAYTSWLSFTTHQAIAKSRKKFHQNDYRWLVKVPLNRQGVRVLRKEAQVVDGLRKAATGTNYTASFPTRVPIGEFENTFSDPNSLFGKALWGQSRFDDLQLSESSVWLFDRRKTDLEMVAQAYSTLAEIDAIRVLIKLFDTLGYVHRLETVHGAILPHHLIVSPDLSSLMVVDWTHCRPSGSRFGHLPRKYLNWYPREALRGERAIPASDIFMAVKIFLHLVGASSDSQQHLVLSRPMRCLVKACLLESPRMRPDDAWALRDELKETLECHWGIPTLLPKP